MLLSSVAVATCAYCFATFSVQFNATLLPFWPIVAALLMFLLCLWSCEYTLRLCSSVALAQFCSNVSPILQERAAGASRGLLASEANRRCCTFDCSCKNVHEAAAVAVWNLTFNPSNALRIVEEGGVSKLVDLCSSSA
ncbi:hypothetical protein PIB30_068693 [Stylosanthes scabra]|uniref:Uncharacterized protein n=1 Tax=Stylosanthes scabra TaxID=79078 RepID=A0ABU6QND9_9FABA|nr:hypothetical protein [Stylosanthes scabra]